MKSTDNNKERIGAPVEIEPVPFRPRRRHSGHRSTYRRRVFVSAALVLFLLVLGTSVWFVFTARRVAIQIEPEPKRISIQGGVARPNFGSHYLLRPGEYRLQAEQQCFRLLSETFMVTEEKTQRYEFTMSKLPGLVSVKAHRADKPGESMEGARIYVDGKEIGQTPGADLEINPGRRSVMVRSEHYQDRVMELEVDGCGTRQELDLALVPGWSDIAIDSVPQGAGIMINGKPAGKTPSTVELPAGEHELVLTAEGFKPWRKVVAVKANQPRKLEMIELQPADGILAVRTNPPGANVMVGSSFAGRTPLELKLTPNTRQLIRIYKDGYEETSRSVTIASQKAETLTIALQPKRGIVNFVVNPPGGQIMVDGKPVGTVPRQLELLAVEHQIEITKNGYQSYRTRITPRPGFPQEVNITLKSMLSSLKSPRLIIKAKNGYELKLIRPRKFTMGSSRREQGRRSNETLRTVTLQRPFYIGTREVTNKEFRQFSSSHNSGQFKTYRLNQGEYPVVGVTWEQAALFCNWLSAKEGLPPVYVLDGEKLIAADPMPKGYRLPTEAEWEFCTRLTAQGVKLKYPWGNAFPPLPRSGNFADESAKNLLPSYLAGYNDGYPVIAPPAKFAANFLGLYDLGGNAAEWCHDYYSIYPNDATKVYTDPLGPEEGKHHVIRGSSWRQGSISTLRSSYRDYDNGKRLDLGFRVGRYMK